MVAGVCGGLGRYCDVDPVIFRIVLGVLSATGGIGLIFYGFAWLLLPLEERTRTRRGGCCRAGSTGRRWWRCCWR